MDYQLYNLLILLLVIFFILGFVTIVMWFKKKERELKANLLLSALEKGLTIDPELFRSDKQSKLVSKYILLALLVCGTGVSLYAVINFAITIIDSVNQGCFNLGLLAGCVVILGIGASLLLGYFKGKKMLQE